MSDKKKTRPVVSFLSLITHHLSLRLKGACAEGVAAAEVAGVEAGAEPALALFGGAARTGCGAGAGAGAATGGVIGALIGAGIPEYRAKVYEAGILRGGILLGVEAKADEEADKLEELLEALGGEHVRAE